MGFRNFNDIKQHRVLGTIELEGNCDGNICLMVW